jgi:hypothetical protein
MSSAEAGNGDKENELKQHLANDDVSGAKCEKFAEAPWKQLSGIGSAGSRDIDGDSENGDLRRLFQFLVFCIALDGKRWPQPVRQ